MLSRKHDIKIVRKILNINDDASILIQKKRKIEKNEKIYNQMNYVYENLLVTIGYVIQFLVRMR